MKIMIIGHVGCGKSTVAKFLSEKYNLPILYMDKIGVTNGVFTPASEALKASQAFLDENEDWVIDGAWLEYCGEERAKLADAILYFNFNRFLGLSGVFKRCMSESQKYPGEIESLEDGSHIKFNWTILKFVLFEQRKINKKVMENVVKQFKHKSIILKNRSQVNKFIETFDDRFKK